MHRIAQPRQFAALQLADAVFGADRSAPAGDHVMHEGADRLAFACFPFARDRRLAGRGRGNAHCHRPDGQRRRRGSRGRPLRPCGTASVDEIGHRGDRHRNIVLHRRADARVRRARFRRAGARTPPPAFRWRRWWRLPPARPRTRFRAATCGERGQGVGSAGIGSQFDQRMPLMAARQRRARARRMRQHGGERMLRHHFEPFQRVARMALARAAAACARRGCRQAPPTAPPGPPARAASRSVAPVTIPSVPSEPISNCLRSNPRLSFFSGVEAIEHRSVRQHRFQPQHLRAHRSVAQHLRAPGVGRDQPANGGRTLAAQRQREAQAMRLRRFVQRLQDQPGVAGDLARIGIEACGLCSSAGARA